VHHRSVVASLFVSAAALCAGAASAQPQRLAVAQMAAGCAGCHGTQGHGAQGSALPVLAGMPRATMFASLQAFRAGARPATIMQQLVKGYTDTQLDQIADYFAAQSR
jgi:cytochrome subunit of sulfide dehydrogenase